MSLARSFISDPHGMIFIHASCDQPLMNSPITKLRFVILNECEESQNANKRCFAMLSMTKMSAGCVAMQASSTLTIEREDSKKTGKNHRLSVKSRKVQSQKPCTFLHIV